MERASLSVIKRDLRRAGLPESTRLVWRIARAQRAASSEKPTIVNKTGLGLPSWVSPQTLGIMGMVGTSEIFIPEEVQRTNMFLSAAQKLQLEYHEAVKIAEVHARLETEENTLNVIPEALRILRGIKDGYYHQYLAYQSAHIMDQSGRHEEMDVFIGTTFGEMQGKENIYLNKATALAKFARTLTRLESAEEAYAVLCEALGIRKTEGSGFQVGELADAARALIRFGKTKEAFRVFQKVIGFARREKAVNELDNMANDLIRLGKTEEAYAVLQEALGFARERKSVTLLKYIANTLTRLGKVEEAHAVYQEALGLEREKCSRDLVDIAISLAQLGKIEEAYSILQEMLRVAREKGERNHQAMIASALIRIGKSKEAFEALKDIAAYVPMVIVTYLPRIDVQIVTKERIQLMEMFKEQLKAEEAEGLRQEELQRQEEAERQRRAEEEKILLNLGSEDSSIREYALGQYIEMNLHEPRVFPQLDAVIVETLGSQRERIDEFRAVAETCDLPLSRALITRIDEEQALRETLGGKIEEITADIMEKIGAALRLNIGHSATASEGNGGSYGSVSMGIGLSLSLQQRIELRQEILPGKFLDIETGETIEEMKERVRVLNFLVHHEVGHLIQEERKIGQPVIGAFSLLDQKEVEHHANEILIDKLAFEAARKIYVHGDGDIIFSESMREAIAIDAHLTLGRIIIRNLEAGAHTLPDECVARFIAVLREISKSKAISAQAKGEISGLADTFRARITADQSEEKIAEIDALIKAYREIFRQTRLD